MVNWIEKMSLLLKRLKDSWMDMSPTTDRYHLHRRETRRQNQFHADMTAEVKKNEAEVRNFCLRIYWKQEKGGMPHRWSPTKGFFPFSENLTTLMFIGANDLGENQRERLTSSLSIQGMDVTTFTFNRVQVAFEDLFCSLEGPIASRYYSLFRTFIIEDGSEEEFGYWVIDEVTGEQGYVDNKHSCFWSQDDNQSIWKSRPFKSRLLMRRK